MLRDRYPSEYRRYHLSRLALSLAAPLLSKETEKWKPLEEPNGPLLAVEELKKLLFIKPKNDNNIVPLGDSGVLDVFREEQLEEEEEADHDLYLQIVCLFTFFFQFFNFIK